MKQAQADAQAAAQAAAFLALHRDTPSTWFAANLHTRVESLRAGELLMPLTVNDTDDCRDNAWVCSPLTTYCDYAREEAARALHPLLGAPVGLVCRGFGAAMKHARIERAVTINNWLLSTNLYPACDAASLRSLLSGALQRWPDHAIWFRSLNEVHNADWLAALRALDVELIPSRQIYYVEARVTGAPMRADLRRDLRLLQHTSLQRVGPGDFCDSDYARIATLYTELYIDKHSRLNPQYTEHFMRAWHAAGLLEFHGFRDADGQLQAVVGLFCQGDFVTAPLLGYNRALPARLGLYRLLMALVLEQGTRRGATVNLSAGAAQFKRLRGARPAIEYSAVFTRHLAPSRRHVIAVLQRLTTSIGVPIMKRYQL